jgi:PAS domain S-box-containing protein
VAQTPWFQRFPKTISLQFVLVVPFVLQTVGAVALVGYLSYRSGEQATKTLAQQLLQQTSARVSDRLDDYLHTPQHIVALNHLAVEQGSLSLDNAEQLRQQLWQQMLLNPSLPATGFWGEDGSAIGYTRISSEAAQKMAEHVSGQTIPLGTVFLQTIKPNQRQFFWTDSQGRSRGLAYQLNDDFRTVTWYRHAKRMGQRGWTPVSLARTIPLIQTFAVDPVYDATGKLQGFFTANYFLSEISLFLHQLQFSPSGQVFIMERSGNLVATSVALDASGMRQVNGNPDRLPAIHSQDERTRRVAQQLLQKFGNFRTVRDTQQLNLTLEGQQDFVQITPYQDDYGLDWLVVTVIPASDFMTEIQRNTQTTSLLCLLTLGVSIASGVAIANRFTARIARLNQASRALAAGDLTQQVQPDSPIAEVQGLAQSFNQMAEQLRQLFQSKVETEATRQSEARFQQLAGSVPGMIYTYTQHPDGSHGFEYASSASRDILELEPEQVLTDINAVLDQIHPDDRSTYNASVAHSLATLEPFVLTFRNTTPSGQVKWLEATSRPLRHNNGRITWYGLLLDISDRKQAEIALKSLVEGTASVTGEEFFPILAQQIAAALNVSHVLVSQQLGDRLQSLAFYADGQIQGQISYPLIHTPCERSLQNGRYYCSSNVQAEFPLDPGLVAFESESYLGMALQSSGGETSGVLCILNRTPIVDPQRTEALLRVFGARAAAEIERLQAMESIQQLNASLEERIQQRTQDLQAERLRLQLALEAVNMGTWGCSLQTGQLRWSDRAQEIFGFVPGTFPGDRETFLAMVHPDDADRVLQAIAHTFETGASYSIEYRIRRLDGEMRWVAVWGIIPQNLSTSTSQLIGVISDITERKQAEQDLQESRTMLKLVLDTIPQRVFWKDRQSRFLGCNTSFANDYQLTIEAIVGKTDLELPWAEWASLYQADDQRVIETQTLKLNYEEPTNNVNGEQIWIRSSKIPLTNSQGEVIGILGCYDDITGLKQAEAALQQLNLELEQRVSDRTLDLQHAITAAEAANRAKSLFLANMSHELRTPLNVILGFTQLMRYDTSLSAEQQEHIRIMYRSGEHLLNLINDILDLSKIEAERITLENTSVDLMDLLSNLGEMFQERAAHNDLDFGLECASDIPQYIVTDSNKLRQVLINLLNNAFKFTNEGRITLHVALEDAKADTTPTTPSSLPSPALVFDIEDTGVGIAPEELATIFDAFTQADAGKLSLEGTGLGLTISRKIVNLMGGELTVCSTVGQGSTFSFFIPLRPANAVDVPLAANQRRVIGLAPGQPTYRVLVVDDQPDNRQLLVKLLSQIGLEVRDAMNGEDAIACWQQWHPHLIWMDIRMPDIDGCEATQRIRAEENESARGWESGGVEESSSDVPSPTKIIALTAQVSNDEHTRSLAAGCDDFVSKPIQVDLILSKVAEHLGLDYVYQEIDHQKQESKFIPSSLIPSLSSHQIMPSAWVAALHQAALNCDAVAASLLIQQIPPEHTALIKGLTHWLQNYRFEAIIRLTQPQTPPSSES